jgi:hypothetical protein
MLSLSKQIVQSRLCAFDFAHVLRRICARLRFEVVAEVGFVLLSDFFRRRFFAVLGFGGVVFHAHLADMQLSVARLADVQSPEREAQCGEGSSAAPTKKKFGHDTRSQ